MCNILFSSMVELYTLDVRKINDTLIKGNKKKREKWGGGGGGS